MYPWFRRGEEKIVRLRKKCLELAEYTYDGRAGQRLHSLMFYNEFLLFMIMLWCFREYTQAGHGRRRSLPRCYELYCGYGYT